MANIQALLSRILSARFGKDVRGSIHGAIAAINQEVTTYTEAEETRVREEDLRKLNERARQSAENNRHSVEQIRLNNERSRTEKETERLRDENTRKSNETLRVSKEEERLQAETTRNQKESIRVVGEERRVEAENRRNQKEQERLLNEERRSTLENERKLAENTRISSENNRVAAEQAREQRALAMKSTFDEKLELINRALSSSSPVTDKTLRLENIAADAKTVGDRLKKIDRDASNLETAVTLKIDTIKNTLVSDRNLTQSGKFADSKAVGDAIRNLTSKVTALEGLQDKVGALESNHTNKKLHQPIKVDLDSEWIAPSDGFIIAFVTSKENVGNGAFYLVSNNEYGDFESSSGSQDERNISIFIKIADSIQTTHMAPIRKGVKYSSVFKQNIESETIIFYPFK